MSSRHGARITEEEVEKFILSDFGTDGSLDLMEFVALLLIPIFAKEEFIDDDPKDNLLSSYMIRVIRKDALDLQCDNDDNSPIELSVNILKRIFRAFGEDALAIQSDLMEQMIAAAASDGDTTGPLLLDANTLARVMAADLDVYFTKNGDSSIHSNRKVIPSDFRRHRKKRQGIMLASTTSATSVDSENLKTESRLELESTLAHIDLAADTVRSRTLVVFTWVSFVISFFTYYSSIGNTNIGNFLVSPIQCEKNRIQQHRRRKCCALSLYYWMVDGSVAVHCHCHEHLWLSLLWIDQHWEWHRDKESTLVAVRCHCGYSFHHRSSHDAIIAPRR